MNRQRLAQFASDNTSAICPEAWAALAEANSDFATPYGEDSWTNRAADSLREVFETDCEVFFCFNGTAANSMSLAHLCRSFHGIIAHRAAHIANDECGGPEFFTHGSKLLLADGREGKLTPDAVLPLLLKRTDIHFPRPRVLSVTQSTEWGTCYHPDELGALAALKSQYDLHLHMDGARFANAVASLGCAPSEVTWRAGVDVLCFGGTKNGLPIGEAVVFFDRNLAKEFDYRCKQAGQLASKMRYLTAPWGAMLAGGAWLKHAAHANEMARRIGMELAQFSGISLVRPHEVNAVFLEIEPELLSRVRAAGVPVYDFIGGGARFMCNWDTTEDDVEELVEVVRRALVTKASHSPADSRGD